MSHILGSAIHHTEKAHRINQGTMPRIEGGYYLVMNREFLNEIHKPPPTLLPRAGRQKELSPSKLDLRF